MTTFITQARFTKDGLNGMIAAPEDRAEIVGRLIAQVGGKLIAYYLTSGEYDILLIFEGPSYQDTVPALIVAAAESGVADLKTVTALTSSEMKSAFVKAGPIAASYRSAVARGAGSSSAEPQTDLSNLSSQREGETAREAQDDVKAATAILNAEKKAVQDIRAGRPAPYYFAPPCVGSSVATRYVSALRQRGSCKKSNVPNQGPAKRSINYAHCRAFHTSLADGERMAALGREFGLTPTQTEAAVAALLPAISTGLKQSTATLDGLGNLFGGQQQNLQAMYDNPETAFGPEGLAAGKDALSVIFGSPDVSRAVIDQAQNFSGVSSNILKKMLPVLAGVLLSGLMRSGSSGRAASPGMPAPSGGGGLGDILGQIFGRGMPGSSSAPAGPAQQFPPPASQPPPLPTDAGGQPTPEGDLLGSILRELEKGIRDGRIKPVIIGGGPVQIPMPGEQQGPMPSGPDAPRVPGGDIFGQILRDVFGGAVGGPAQMPQGRQGQSPQMKDLSDLSKQLGVMGGAGAAVFGDHFEPGRDVEKEHVDNIQNVFDRFFGAHRRE